MELSDCFALKTMILASRDAPAGATRFLQVPSTQRLIAYADLASTQTVHTLYRCVLVALPLAAKASIAECARSFRRTTPIRRSETRDSLGTQHCAST